MLPLERSEAQQREEAETRPARQRFLLHMFANDCPVPNSVRPMSVWMMGSRCANRWPSFPGSDRSELLPRDVGVNDELQVPQIDDHHFRGPIEKSLRKLMKPTE